MNWLLLIFGFTVGMAVGSQLPNWIARFHASRRQRAFRPVILQPYNPPSDRDAGGHP